MRKGAERVFVGEMDGVRVVQMKCIKSLIYSSGMLVS